MPRGDGKGPLGRGSGTGRGLGSGGGMGRGGGRGLGPGGYCVCPKCGYREPHTPGEPCMKKRCPKCGSVMTRG
ncbi:MAG: hypothetical protein DRP84_09105 [Spirochaetes bacterium]|nr:MAG: hypothetical protein DRP84_09105 [Spirochaetota bacterium]RKY01688.1 MAG: hypothetical protein DRP55_03890 [Spirochaetota bacterium]